RKRPLCLDDLLLVFDSLHESPALDDLLFLAQIHVGFDALLRCGELTRKTVTLTWPDLQRHQSYRKLSLRHMLVLAPGALHYTLPSHKADQFGDGHSILITGSGRRNDTLSIMSSYIAARDVAFPYHPQLWLRSNGQVPTRSWFTQRLRTFFPSSVSGHSMRSGGATAMANAG
ncbi:hypothetical protein BU15DRAFT_33870, partial [Melanogaster broomeanus]